MAQVDSKIRNSHYKRINTPSTKLSFSFHLNSWNKTCEKLGYILGQKMIFPIRKIVRINSKKWQGSAHAIFCQAIPGTV